MFMEERQQQIAEIIDQTGKITVSQITEKFEISDESARRDLRILEQKGLCKRTHGGAIRLSQVNVRPPEDRSFDSMVIFDTYREIVREAIKRIRPNDMVYLTGGSFGHILCAYLPKDFRYTVVVNNVEMGKELRQFDNIDVFVVGGKMRKSGSITDSLANDFVSRMHFDLCFITGAGLTASFGLSNGTDETATFQRTVMKNSRYKCLLIPGAKVGVDSFIKVCEAEKFDEIITDWDCLEEQICSLEDKEIKVTVVENPGEEK
ncbi:MAG: DeoR/GlpR transcriptional regulator [Firmicutes bacterium]|nr:DeoR/GlpR transcriptional regulator [Bacillota bacterium]